MNVYVMEKQHIRKQHRIRLVTVDLGTRKVPRTLGAWLLWCTVILAVGVALNYATMSLRFMTLELKTETLQVGAARLENARQLAEINQTANLQMEPEVVREMATLQLGMMPTESRISQTFADNGLIGVRDKYMMTPTYRMPYYNAFLEQTAQQVDSTLGKRILQSLLETGRAAAAVAQIADERRQK